MRELTVSKTLFDRVFWTAINAVPAENDADLETCIRVIRKLKQVSVESPTDDGVPGRDRRLNVPSHTFYFQEDEKNLIEKRIKKSIPMFLGYVAEELYELLDIVRNAKEVTDAPQRTDIEHAGMA